MSAEDAELPEQPLQAFHRQYGGRTDLRIIQTPSDLLDRRFDRGDVQTFLQEQLDGVGNESLVVCGDPSDSLVWSHARLAEVRRPLHGALLRCFPDAIILREKLGPGSSMWASIIRNGLVAKLKVLSVKGEKGASLNPRLFIEERQPSEWVMRDARDGSLGVLTVATPWTESDGHLYGYLKDHPGTAQSDRVLIARRFSTDIAALHAQGLTHCDVKLTNLTKSGGLNDLEFAQHPGGPLLTLGTPGYTRGAYDRLLGSVTGCEDDCATARVVTEILLGRSLVGQFSGCVDFRALQTALIQVIADAAFSSNVKGVLCDLVVSSATVQDCAKEISDIAA